MSDDSFKHFVVLLLKVPCLELLRLEISFSISFKVMFLKQKSEESTFSLIAKMLGCSLNFSTAISTGSSMP